MKPKANARPPKDDLCRAIASNPMLQLQRSESGDAGDGMPTLIGEFAKFDQWTEIDSYFEGRFLERIDPKAFNKTFKENRSSMRVLFQHGMDPQIADKPLGPIQDLRATDTGAHYEVPLLDVSYVHDLIPGLEQDLYGASFRFRVMREEIVEDPGVSDHNPLGLPERTIKEALVKEFGPVTFPAYEGATAGVRSMTDYFHFRQLQNADPERIQQLAAYWREEHGAASEASAGELEDRFAPLADAVAALTPADGEQLTAEDLERVREIFAPLTTASPAPAGTSAPDSDEEPCRAPMQDAKAPDVRATPTRDYLNPKKERPSWML